MKEIKLTIDGKEVQLTDEQLRMLGIETEKKRKNPFERVAKTEMYCYIDSFDEVNCVTDDADHYDDMSFKCSNYFNDEQFAKQVALHQLLYRKLLKFAYDMSVKIKNGTEQIYTSILYTILRKRITILVGRATKRSRARYILNLPHGQQRR